MTNSFIYCTIYFYSVTAKFLWFYICLKNTHYASSKCQFSMVKNNWNWNIKSQNYAADKIFHVMLACLKIILCYFNVKISYPINQYQIISMFLCRINGGLNIYRLSIFILHLISWNVIAFREWRYPVMHFNL